MCSGSICACRPDAGATQIAISTDAGPRTITKRWARNWERAAMIKAARLCRRSGRGGRDSSPASYRLCGGAIWIFAAIEDIHSNQASDPRPMPGTARSPWRAITSSWGAGGIRENRILRPDTAIDPGWAPSRIARSRPPSRRWMRWRRKGPGGAGGGRRNLKRRTAICALLEHRPADDRGPADPTPCRASPDEVAQGRMFSWAMRMPPASARG